MGRGGIPGAYACLATSQASGKAWVEYKPLDWVSADAEWYQVRAASLLLKLLTTKLRQAMSLASLNAGELGCHMK